MESPILAASKLRNDNTYKKCQRIKRNAISTNKTLGSHFISYMIFCCKQNKCLYSKDILNVRYLKKQTIKNDKKWFFVQLTIFLLFFLSCQTWINQKLGSRHTKNGKIWLQCTIFVAKRKKKLKNSLKKIETPFCTIASIIMRQNTF